jgi:hypothetical protein
MFDVIRSAVIKETGAGSEEDRSQPARTLYVTCPVLLALLLGLSLAIPHGIVIYAFYTIAVVSALPTWDRRFVKEMALAAAVFVLLEAALMGSDGANPWQRLLNCTAGLLAIWAGLHLALEAIAAYDARLKELIDQAQSVPPVGTVTGHLVILCAWTKRVKEGDKWVPLEEFLERHFQVRISHGMSDEVHDTLVRKEPPTDPEST